MEWFYVSARFLFFNGKDRYTVHYAYGIAKWFVFREEETTNALMIKEDKKIKFKNINKDSAGDILHEYLKADF